MGAGDRDDRGIWVDTSSGDRTPALSPGGTLISGGEKRPWVGHAGSESGLKRVKVAA